MEADIQEKIVDALTRLGFWVERTNAGQVDRVRLLSAGTPDLLLVAPCYGWLEVKRPGEKLNANQRRWHGRAKRAGVRVAVVTSVQEAANVAVTWKAADPVDALLRRQ